MKLSLDQSFEVSSRVITPEGFLCFKGHAARAGIQQYLAGELDLPGDPSRIVNVYRPPEEVFAPESLASYEDKDVSDDHPDDLISADSFKQHSIGHITAAGSQEGDWVSISGIVKDAGAIAKIQSGKAQLSAGYMAEYVPETGKSLDGTPYEFVQRNIRINHVAVVEAARAGDMARIFDHKPKGEPPMTQRKVVLDSKRKLSVTLDEEAAVVVEDAIKHFKDAADEAEEKASKAEAKADAAEEAKEDAEKKSSDSAITGRVKEIIAVNALASKIVKGFDSAGELNPVEIKRACMAKKFPSRDWASKDAAYVHAAFDAESEKEESEEEEETKKSEDSRENLKKFADDFKSFQRPVSDGHKAYDEFLKGSAK